MIMKNATGVAVFTKMGTLENYARGKGYCVNGQVPACYKEVKPIKLWVYYRWKNDPEYGKLFTCSFSGPDNPFPMGKRGEMTDVRWNVLVKMLSTFGYTLVSESIIRN